MINRHLLASCPFDSEGTKVSKERKWWPFDQVVKMDIQFFYFTKKAKGKSLRRRVTLSYYSYRMYKGDKEKDHMHTFVLIFHCRKSDTVIIKHFKV